MASINEVNAVPKGLSSEETSEVHTPRAVARRENVDPQHFTEWRDSGVAAQIIRDNVRSCRVSFNPYDEVAVDDPYEALLYGLPDSERRNDGRLRDRTLRKYQHLEDGGWWCGSEDLLSPNCSSLSLWGCFKSNKPRRTIDGKLIKYEHPPQVSTELFALKVNRSLWEKIAQRFNVEIGDYIYFWQWVLHHPQIPILITEGAKKAGVLLTSNYVVIALPGVHNGYRQPKNEYGEKIGQPHLIPQLEILATPGRELIIVFDHDTKPKTVFNVDKAIKTTGELLLEKGCLVSVITWNYPEKGVDDLIVQYGVEVFHQLYESRSSFAQWQDNLENALFEQYKTQAWEQWRKIKQFSSMVQLKKKFFEYGCPQSETITFIKSPIGTGKTTWLCNILKELAAQEMGGISLGYRNTLLLQFCAKSDFYHLHEHNVLSLKLLYDEQGKIAACVDSLLHFWTEYFRGKILIIDEVVSVIKHLLFSRTIPISKLVPILQRFIEAVKMADRVICLDGLMTNWVVDYFKRICPEKQIVTVENVSSSNQPKVYLLNGTINPKTLKKKKNDKRLFYLKLLHDSAIPAVCSDSQIFLEALESIFISQGRNGLRVDSKTVPESWVKEFLANPTEYIKQHRLEYLLYSPSAESGLDVPLEDYFSEHFGFFFGCIDVDSIIQMIGRIRDKDVPKYLWVRETALVTDYEGTRSPIPATVEWAKNQCLIRELNWSLDEIPDSAQIVSSLINLVDTCKDTHWQTAIEIEAMWNHEKAHLRECVLEMLTSGGHSVDLVEVSVDDLLKAKLKEVSKQIAQSQDSVKTQNSVDIYNSSDEYIGKSHLIHLQFDARWEQRCKLMKAKLIDKLPGISNSELWNEQLIKFVLYDEPSLINQLELFWLVNNPEIAKQLSQEKYNHLLSKGLEGEPIAPWKLRYQYSTVKALLELGIVHLVTHPKLKNYTYSASDPIIQAIFTLGQQKKFKQALGRAPGKDPMKYVSSLLRMISAKFKAHQVRGTDGGRYWVYRIDHESLNNPYRQLILECINRRLLTRYFEALNWEVPPLESPFSHSLNTDAKNSPLTQAGQRLKPVTDLNPSCIHNRGESVTNLLSTNTQLAQNDLRVAFQRASNEELFAIAQDFQLAVAVQDFETFALTLKAYKTVLNRQQLNQVARLLSVPSQKIIRKWVDRINQLTS